MLPISHFAHAAAMCDRDDSNSYCGKEVIIICGPDSGCCRNIVSEGWDTCVVAQGAFTTGTYVTDSVVAW